MNGGWSWNIKGFLIDKVFSIEPSPKISITANLAELGEWAFPNALAALTAANH